MCTRAEPGILPGASLSWYLARPLDKPDTTFLGYYPYSFPGFVDMIQGDLDK